MTGSESGWADACVEAYRLLEEVQRAHDTDLRPALRRSRERGWPDIELVLHYAEFARAEVTGGDGAPPLARMEELVEPAGDLALAALVAACSATYRSAGPDAWSTVDTRLAEAIALLSDGSGSAVHRPAAWVECALAYRSATLWELEEEMLAAAAAATDTPWEPSLDPVRVLAARGVLFNRIEARAQRVGELLELGDRDAAARLARESESLPGPHRAGVGDRAWEPQVSALRSLLAAAAGRPESAPDPPEWGGTGDGPDPDGPDGPDWSGWPGYRCLLDLARAVRAADAGDETRAADLAEAALAGFVPDQLPSLRRLALALTARRPPRSAAAERYANELAEAHAASRSRMLAAARVHRDHERLRHENRSLAAHAWLDQLTGVANRHAYSRHLDRLRRGGGSRQVAVVVVDVDWFKKVNDTYGHGVGDLVLRRVAESLAAHVRTSDLVARLGGDEFIVLLDAGGAGTDVIAARARRMIDAVLEGTWSDLARGLTPSVSAGFALGSAEQVDDVVEAADRALYRAKERGRHRLVGC